MNKKISNHERAEVLTQALPYIRRYSGKIVVVKYGGNAMTDEQLKQQVMEDIVLLWLIGVNVVLVHGGGPEISDTMQALGKEPEWIDGLRVTDAETADIVQMVLAGKVNKTLVGLLQAQGGNAMGICGIDGGLIRVRQKDPRLGYVGEITEINLSPIIDLLEDGYIPVVSTLGVDETGSTYNINGDTAAAFIAGALQAERLILMTNINGIRRDESDPDSLITGITVDEARSLQDEGIVTGGMIPKVECCVDAIESGVQSVVILDGRIPHSLLMELLTDEGAGTMILPNRE